MPATYVRSKRQELRIKAVEVSVCFFWQALQDKGKNDFTTQALRGPGEISAWMEADRVTACTQCREQQGRLRWA
jgi:hypothetical protein